MKKAAISGGVTLIATVAVVYAFQVWNEDHAHRLAAMTIADINDPEMNTRIVGDTLVIEGRGSGKESVDRAGLIAKAYATAARIPGVRSFDVLNLVEVVAAPYQYPVANICTEVKWFRNAGAKVIPPKEMGMPLNHLKDFQLLYSLVTCAADGSESRVNLSGLSTKLPVSWRHGTLSVAVQIYNRRSDTIRVGLKHADGAALLDETNINIRSEQAGLAFMSGASKPTKMRQPTNVGEDAGEVMVVVEPIIQLNKSIPSPDPEESAN